MAESWHGELIVLLDRVPSEEDLKNVRLCLFDHQIEEQVETPYAAAQSIRAKFPDVEMHGAFPMDLLLNDLEKIQGTEAVVFISIHPLMADNLHCRYSDKTPTLVAREIQRDYRLELIEFLSNLTEPIDVVEELEAASDETLGVQEPIDNEDALDTEEE